MDWVECESRLKYDYKTTYDVGTFSKPILCATDVSNEKMISDTNEDIEELCGQLLDLISNI